jgi:hypothetical protein
MAASKNYSGTSGEEKVNEFKKKFKNDVINKLNQYANNHGEVGKNYMLFLPKALKENFAAEIELMFDRFLKYKPALPYKVLIALMNERKIYFKDGIYKPENLTFERADPPERIIFIDFLANKKGLICYLIRYEKDKSITSLMQNSFSTTFLFELEI